MKQEELVSIDILLITVTSFVELFTERYECCVTQVIDVVDVKIFIALTVVNQFSKMIWKLRYVYGYRYTI
jgi:hypothetical protein